MPLQLEIPRSIIYEEFHPELRTSKHESAGPPPQQGQIPFGQTWFWHLHPLEASQPANEEMSHVSGDSVTGLLRARKFPERHALQPRHSWIARLPTPGCLAPALWPPAFGQTTTWSLPRSPLAAAGKCGRMPGIPEGPRGCLPWAALALPLSRLSPFMPIKEEDLLQ